MAILHHQHSGHAETEAVHVSHTHLSQAPLPACVTLADSLDFLHSGLVHGMGVMTRALSVQDLWYNNLPPASLAVHLDCLSHPA